jgi:hypothetical protein
MELFRDENETKSRYSASISRKSDMGIILTRRKSNVEENLFLITEYLHHFRVMIGVYRESCETSAVCTIVLL